MDVLSQRDPKWSGDRLGFGSKNTTTIGGYGCTITCVAMLAGITPKEVNDRLIAVKGYAASSTEVFNLIIWAKVTEAIPWLKFEWRGYAYQNDEVVKNLPCLVEVDGARIGASKHWVLYVGDQKMHDPWTGVIKATNYYPATGYAIIKRIGDPPKNTVAVDADAFPGLVHGSTQWDKTVAEYRPENDPKTTQFEDVQRVVSGYKSRVTSLETDIKKLDDEYKKALIEIDNQKDKVANIEDKCQREVKLLKDDIAIKIELIETLDKVGGSYKAVMIELEGDLRAAQKQTGILQTQIGELKNKLRTYETEMVKNCIAMLYQKLVDKVAKIHQMLMQK